MFLLGLEEDGFKSGTDTYDERWRIQLSLRGSDVGVHLCCGGSDFCPRGSDFGFSGSASRPMFYGGSDFYTVLNVFSKLIQGADRNRIRGAQARPR